ncbi:hypothetical protein DKX38_013729 [Salix brachista]|uniref:Uncharacterized protein n=1 Tax=Salix brachista TaxID=2182728 RepID=A0A5N5LDE0_9ROSI|nr:hypothetical protein DKX38_013729 [Salix brachista]
MTVPNPKSETCKKDMQAEGTWKDSRMTVSLAKRVGSGGGDAIKLRANPSEQNVVATGLDIPHRLMLSLTCPPLYLSSSFPSRAGRSDRFQRGGVRLSHSSAEVRDRKPTEQKGLQLLFLYSKYGSKW